MATPLVCWKCGGTLAGVPQPFSRRAVCPACSAELHVCRMCRLYNPRISDRCDEPRAEHPREVDRANFCDWYSPRPDAHRPRSTAKSQAARDRLGSLFGDAPTEDRAGGAQEALDRLFRKDS